VALERALRRGVLWRKRSFGHQSESGRAFVERLLTAVGSLRLQGRNVLAYLEARAALNGTSHPSLLSHPAASPPRNARPSGIIHGWAPLQDPWFQVARRE
jgi:hypothetical protein